MRTCYEVICRVALHARRSQWSDIIHVHMYYMYIHRESARKHGNGSLLVLLHASLISNLAGVGCRYVGGWTWSVLLLLWERFATGVGCLLFGSVDPPDVCSAPKITWLIFLQVKIRRCFGFASSRRSTLLDSYYVRGHRTGPFARFCQSSWITEKNWTADFLRNCNMWDICVLSKRILCNERHCESTMSITVLFIQVLLCITGGERNIIYCVDGFAQ